MADLPSPIVVNPNPTAEIIFVAIRQIGLVISGALTILGFVRTRDLVGLLAYVRSDDFYPVLAAATLIAIVVYGWLRSLWNKRKLVIAATHAPDAIAQVKGQ